MTVSEATIDVGNFSRHNDLHTYTQNIQFKNKGKAKGGPYSKGV